MHAFWGAGVLPAEGTAPIQTLSVCLALVCVGGSAWCEGFGACPGHLGFPSWEPELDVGCPLTGGGGAGGQQQGAGRQWMVT